MRRLILLVELIGMAALSACLQPSPAETTVRSVPPGTPGLDRAASTAVALSPSSKVGGQLPYFLHVSETTLMGGASVPRSPLQVGAGAFRFNSEARKLLVEASIAEEGRTAQLLIGVSSILQTPGQVFENRAIVMYPPGQPVLIRIVTVDLNTGTVRLSYDGTTYDVPPGERLTFKEAGGNGSSLTVIRVIVNYGRLVAIGPISPDGSLP